MANVGIYEDDYYDHGSQLGVDSDEESNFDSSLESYSTGRPPCDTSSMEHTSPATRAEAKAQEAADERVSNPTVPPISHASSHNSSQRPLSRREAEALMASEEAPPPDYHSATAGPRTVQSSMYSQPPLARGSFRPESPSNIRDAQHSSHRQAEDSLHQSDARWPFDNRENPFRDGHPSGAERAASGPNEDVARMRHSEQFGNHPSQSMRDARTLPFPGQTNDEDVGLLTGKKSPGKRKQWLSGRGCCGSLLTCSIATIVITLVLLGIVAGVYKSLGHKGDHRKVDKRPLGPPRMVIPPTLQCPYEHYSGAVYEFANVDSFSFQEFLETKPNWAWSTQGTVSIRPAAGHQASDIKLSLSYATTKPWVVTASNVAKGDNSFVLNYPDMQEDLDNRSTRPCLHVFVSIEVKPGVKVNSWETTTSILDITIEDGLFSHGDVQAGIGIEITGQSTFNTIAGKAKIDYWSSRETMIETISGSINGTFALRDLLSLKTQSGAIRAAVEPKQADQDHVKPAEFLAKSASAHIDVKFPRSGYIPEREYRSRIEGYSSHISGTYILGASTIIRTQSGGIRAELLPVCDRDAYTRSHLTTEALSGSTRLMVLSPYNRWARGGTIHKSKSTSGHLEIQYPQVWEGALEAQSFSGGIKVEGDGVQIIKDEKRYGQRHVRATKGNGQGSIALESMSGRIYAKLGET